jgi:hypothetical protein
MTDDPAQRPQPAAGPKSDVERARTYRERKKTGARTLRISVTDAERDEFIRVGVLSADRRDDDASIQAAIEQLCRRGHRALLAEQREAATRPQLSKANEYRLASLEETVTSRPAKS